MGPRYKLDWRLGNRHRQFENGGKKKNPCHCRELIQSHPVLSDSLYWLNYSGPLGPAITRLIIFWRYTGYPKILVVSLSTSRPMPLHLHSFPRAFHQPNASANLQAKQIIKWNKYVVNFPIIKCCEEHSRVRDLSWLRVVSRRATVGFLQPLAFRAYAVNTIPD